MNKDDSMKKFTFHASHARKIAASVLALALTGSLLGCAGGSLPFGDNPTVVQTEAPTEPLDTNGAHVVDTGIGEYRFDSYADQLQAAQAEYELHVPPFLPGSYGEFAMLMHTGCGLSFSAHRDIMLSLH